MFACTGFLVCCYSLRDSRAKKKLLKKIANPGLADEVGFAVVDGVWTWHCDMPEMQSTFIAQHLPATDEVIQRLLAEDDSVDLETIMSANLAQMDVERGMERRRAAMARAQRAAEQRSMVDNAGAEAAAPEEASAAASSGAGALSTKLATVSRAIAVNIGTLKTSKVKGGNKKHAKVQQEREIQKEMRKLDDLVLVEEAQAGGQGQTGG